MFIYKMVLDAKDDGENILLKVVEYSESKFLKVLKLLIEKGVDINVPLFCNNGYIFILNTSFLSIN